MFYFIHSLLIIYQFLIISYEKKGFLGYKNGDSHSALPRPPAGRKRPRSGDGSEHRVRKELT